MRYFLLSFLFFNFQYFVAGECRVRREIRDLPPHELKEYINAVKKLQEKKDKSGYSVLDVAAGYHDVSFGPIHSAPFFFPWHRKLLYYIEDELRQFSPNITIPYWDWTYDAAKPANSIVFSDSWFGPAATVEECFKTGNFKNYKVKYPEERCLHRGFANNGFFSRNEIEELKRRSKTHTDLVINLSAPHGVPHTTIGGDMARTFSPNDPVFFLHHSNVDRLWYEWQISGGGNNYQWTLEEPLPVFGDEVKEWIDPKTYCIKYEPPKAIRGAMNLNEIPMENPNEDNASLPQRFIYQPEEVITEPLVNVSDMFLKMHNLKREDFLRVKTMVDRMRMLARNKKGHSLPTE